MKTYIIIILTALFLTACNIGRGFQPPPVAWELFYKRSEGDVSYTQITDDMRECGFISNTANIAIMNKSDYIQAHKCMESKGYKHSGALKSGVCKHSFYRIDPACQKHIAQ